MRSVRSSILLGLLFLMGSGCATIVHGSRQEVKVFSEPEGATVFVDNEAVGTTPITIEIERENRHLIRLEQDGYVSQTQLLTRQASPWAIVGGVVFAPGLIVDWLSGSLYAMKPGQVYLEMEPSR